MVRDGLMAFWGGAVMLIGELCEQSELNVAGGRHCVRVHLKQLLRGGVSESCTHRVRDVESQTDGGICACVNERAHCGCRFSFLVVFGFRKNIIFCDGYDAMR